MQIKVGGFILLLLTATLVHDDTNIMVIIAPLIDSTCTVHIVYAVYSIQCILNVHTTVYVLHVALVYFPKGSVVMISIFCFSEVQFSQMLILVLCVFHLFDFLACSCPGDYLDLSPCLLVYLNPVCQPVHC